jgi:hypothetical protein
MPPPLPLRANATTRPFGEKLGSSLLPSSWVIRVILPVSRSSVTMS